MAFSFKFGRQSNEAGNLNNEILPNNDGNELTEEELDDVFGYNSYPYGFPEEQKNDEDELAIPKRGKR